MEPEETTAQGEPVAPAPLHEGSRMKIMKRVLLGFGAVALLAVGTAALGVPPRITWTPNPLVTESIAPGEQATYSVTLKNTGYLPIPATKQLHIVAEGAIAPYVTVTPPTFPAVFNRGQSVTFDVMVSVPADAPIGVSDGTLVLKRVLPNGKVKEVWRAEGLAVSVEVVWPTVISDEFGLSFQVPLHTQVVFDEKYQEYAITSDTPQSEISDAPGIYISMATNPELLSVQEYFDGDPGIDYFGQSANEFDIITVDDYQAYLFEPYITSSGGKIVVVERTNDFLVIFDSGLTINDTSQLETIIASMEVE